MKKEQRKHYQQRLLALQQELMGHEQVNEEAAGVVELDQTRVGRLSRMDAMQGQAMSQDIQRRRKIDLQRIERALERLENYEYGDCLRCEEPIAEARLEFDPAATHCIECAQSKE